MHCPRQVGQRPATMVAVLPKASPERHSPSVTRALYPCLPMPRDTRDSSIRRNAAAMIRT
jgi:hypothetical protein